LTKGAEALNARVTSMKIPLNLNYSDDSPDLQNQQEDQPDSKSQLSKDKNSNSSPKPINDIVSQFGQGVTATGQDEQTHKPSSKKRIVKSAPDPSLRQQIISQNEHELDELWFKIKDNKREQKSMLKDFEYLKKLNEAHTLDPLADSD